MGRDLNLIGGGMGLKPYSKSFQQGRKIRGRGGRKEGYGGGVSESQPYGDLPRVRFKDHLSTEGPSSALYPRGESEKGGTPG